jgi:hypothetical protein
VKVVGITPNGERYEWPVDRHLQPIADLLASGRNVRVTLTKDDGEVYHYELPKRYDLYRCAAGHTALHDDGICHAAVFGEECGLSLYLSNMDPAN